MNIETYYAVPRCTMQCHAVLYHIILCSATLYYAISYYAVPRCTMPYHTMQCHAVLCSATLYYAISYYAVPRCTLPYRTMQCHAVLYYVVLCSVNQIFPATRGRGIQMELTGRRPYQFIFEIFLFLQHVLSFIFGCKWYGLSRLSRIQYVITIYPSLSM